MGLARCETVASGKKKKDGERKTQRMSANCEKKREGNPEKAVAMDAA